MSPEAVYSLIKNFYGDEFDVHLNNLKHPDHVFVRDFYTRILMEYEVDSENLVRSTIFSDERFADEDTTDVNLVGAVNVGFKFLNLTYNDLMNPADNVKRTVTLIGQAMEYLTYCDTLMGRLDLEAAVQEKEQLKVKEAENLRISHERSKLEIKKVKLSDQMQQVKHQLGELEDLLNIKKQDLSRVTNSDHGSSALLQKLSKLRAEQENLVAENRQLENEISIFEKTLISIPQLEKANKKKEEWKAKCHEKNKELDELNQVFETNKLNASKFEAIGTLCEKSSQLQESRNSQKENLKKMRDGYEKIQADWKIYSRKMSIVIDNLSALKNSDARLNELLDEYLDLVDQTRKAKEEIYRIVGKKCEEWLN
ncbi:Hypothetical protein NTJ_09012 [Nesidiocoris tenuis]|uniref:Uncharacterized protein n=1 Tax=Nesidiocoris tenuis TaxID=355587 RepID=A0ABN7AW89_9HEMI|nr:Hypothetical protein NTJ_09012 [Nesidiocoris tenuis]